MYPARETFKVKGYNDKTFMNMSLRVQLIMIKIMNRIDHEQLFCGFSSTCCTYCVVDLYLVLS